MNAAEAERDRLVRELSELAIRIYQSGGPGGLAASACALAEGAAAAMPGGAVPEFCKRLMVAVASGARIAGHDFKVVLVAEEVASKESVH